MDKLLRQVLRIGTFPNFPTSQSHAGTMGEEKIQEVENSSAQRFLVAVAERMKAYGLELEQNKTRMVDFSPRRFGKGSGIFDFLGFTHHVGEAGKKYFE